MPLLFLLIALAPAARAATPARDAEPERAAAGAAAAAGRDGEGAGAPVLLDLVVRHRLTEGRMVVRLGEQAYLSIPMAIAGASEVFERRLSIPPGPHAITVQFLDASGRLLAEETTREPEPSGRAAVLRIAEHSGSGDGLTLDWRTP